MKTTMISAGQAVPEEIPPAQPPTLGSTNADRIALVLKGAAGTIPVVGGAIAELVGSIIPGQRMDRLVDFVERLGRKLAHVERDVLDARMRQEEFTDLLEDGLLQAA